MKDEEPVEVTSSLASSEVVCRGERAVRAKETYESQSGVSKRGALVWYVDYRSGKSRKTRRREGRGREEATVASVGRVSVETHAKRQERKWRESGPQLPAFRRGRARAIIRQLRCDRTSALCREVSRKG